MRFLSPPMRAHGLTIAATLALAACVACGASNSDRTTGGDTRSSAGDSDVDPRQADSDAGDTDGGNTGGVSCSGFGDQVTCTVCPSTTPPPSQGGVCDIEVGSGNHVLMEGTVLAGAELFKNGRVLIEQGDSGNGTILCVGCDCDAHVEAATATRLSCGQNVISPGLINPHDHTTFALSHPQGHGDERYDHRHDWRKGLREHTRLKTRPSRDSSREGILYGELRMLFGGATSIAGSTPGNTPAGLLRNLDNAGQTEGLTSVNVDYRTFPLGDSNGTLRSSGCDYPNIDDPTRAHSADSYAPHIAEGIDAEAHNEFRCVTTAAGADLLGSNTSITHGIALLGEDIATMGAEGMRLIWSPRSNISLYGNTAPVVAMRNLGIPIGLGTDWSASGSMNLLRELRCADHLNQTHYDGTFSNFELWLMVTHGAAITMGADDQIGLLAPGYAADITIFDASANSDYRAIIDAEVEDVRLVLRGGTPLMGDSMLILGLVGDASKCEYVEVCGDGRLLCLERDTGLRIETLMNAVDANAYGLFYCDTPPNEPSCDPARTGEYPTSMPNDRDGDGIEDALDNCPAVFNPIRPLDNGNQANSDGDSSGDACDLCVTDPSNTCSMPLPFDRDGDGVRDFEDNCPGRTNPEQEDADDDDQGDLCDACPDFPNAPGEPCPFSIYELKDGTVGFGTAVALNDALVTAASTSDGFYLQVHPDDEGYVGIDNSAVFVFAQGLATPPAVGDRIDMTATLDEFFSGIELVSVASLSILSSGNDLPTAILVEPATVATGGARQLTLEGTLVEVRDVEVTDVTPELGAGDHAPAGEILLDDSLRVDNYFHSIDPTPGLGHRYDSITGVLRWANGNSKLEPRNAGDIVRRVGLAGLEPGQAMAFMLENSNGATDPALRIIMSQSMLDNTQVALTYSAAATLSGPESVTVLAGEQSASIDVTSGSADTTPATVTATLGDSSFDASVRVYGASEMRSIESLTPDTAEFTADSTQTFVLTLDLPAPAGGAVVALSADPGTTVTMPSSVTIDAGQRTASFDVLALSLPGYETLSAHLDTSTVSASVRIVEASTTGLVLAEVFYNPTSVDDLHEWVKLYNGTSASIDLSTYALAYAGDNWAGGEVSPGGVVTLSGIVPAGSCFVIGGPQSDTVNANPSYDLTLNFDPNLQNGGSTADGVALFPMPADQVTTTTLPHDSVVYGTENKNDLIDNTGGVSPISVGNAPGGSSLLRLEDGSWQVNPAPTPNICPTF